MMQPAIVSTECPSCGAPLDFGEGSNAVRCQHCDSQLLVTGRTQLLSYAIAPRIDARDAARAAAYACESAGRPGRVREAALWLVPYYRMTGHDLRWEWTVTERQRQEKMDDSEARLLARVMPHGMPVELPSPDSELRQLQLCDRYIEKSFLACQVEGLGLPVSLGLRPTVLRLQLFRPESFAHGNTPVRVLPPTLAPDRAWEVGLKAVGAGESVYRGVLRQVLSLVYQPLWAVTVKAATDAVLLVDAVTGKPLGQIENPLRADESLEPTSPAAITVGLRPLVCPNCGWAFPLQPDEVIAACTSCWRAYAIRGSDLDQIDYRVGAVSAETEEAPTHLPFWVLDASLEKERFQLHIPAFRYRRLKFLVDIARAFAAKAPIYTNASASNFSGRGAFYDREDAAALAAVALAATDPTSDRKAKQLKKSPLQVQDANLVWLPYRQERDALIDPFTQRAFLLSLLA